MKVYYVYVLINPRNNSVFYVGKGKRINNHFRELDKYLDLISKGIPIRTVKFSNIGKLSMMKMIREEGFETKAEKLIENISENAAYVLEEQLVERIGRSILKNGPLVNIEPGGNWEYPKIVLNDNEKTSYQTIKNDYPELILVLEKFPHTAKESEVEKKILKNISDNNSSSNNNEGKYSENIKEEKKSTPHLVQAFQNYKRKSNN